MLCNYSFDYSWLDAYGTSDVPHYTVSTSGSLGGSQFNAWVRVSFFGSMRGRSISFDKKCTINCDANGNSSASWTS